MQARRALMVLVATIAAAACSDTSGPEPVTVDMVAGTYAAAQDFGVIRFTTVDGDTTDWLEAGATVSLQLNADGTTAGDLFIPGADAGADLEADLMGTWQLLGTTVTLNQGADTFLRDMEFSVVGDRLEGVERFSGTTVELTLERQ